MSPMPGGRTLKQGQVRVMTGTGLNLAPRLFSNLFEEATSSAKDIYEGNSAFTEERGRRLVEIGAWGTFFHFLPIYELGVQVGVTGWMDLGFRYGGGALEFATQFELFRQGRHSMTVGAQLTWLSFKPPNIPGLGDLLSWLEMTRVDLQLPVIYGMELFAGSMFYAGLAYRVIFLDMKAEFRDATKTLAQTDLTTPFHTFGGMVGVRLGYKFIFAYIELGVHHAWWSPQVFGKRVPTSSMIIYPTIGLMGQFGGLQ